MNIIYCVSFSYLPFPSQQFDNFPKKRKRMRKAFDIE